MLRSLPRCCGIYLLLGLILSGLPARGDAGNELAGYQHAVGQRDVGIRILMLEQFLQSVSESRLRYDALETLVWDYIQTNQSEKAQAQAKTLLGPDPNNALALAVVSDAATVSSQSAQKEAREGFASAQRGIASYGQLQRPAGMSDGEFALLRRYVAATLSGQAGLGYLEQKDYQTARDYLRQAVVGAPNDGRYVYGLALALLNGKKADPKEGYWQLARAVVMSRGSSAGDQIAEFARRSYEKAGGTPAAWDQFLASAEREIPEKSLATRATQRAAAAPSSAITAKKVQSVATTASAAKAPSPAAIPPPAFQRDDVPRDAPLSLGIVIQSSHLTPENRRILTAALIDMVRRLRRNDEAFIIAFSDKLDFEEDLTGNDKRLEDAIRQVQPASGAALYDAVEFAAGHLERIGRNKNRVLLLISDGRNTKDSSPQFFSSELTHVRVNCIGMNADGADEHRRLVALASYSGGVAAFASGPEQIRSAARQIAQSMGIGFPE